MELFYNRQRLINGSFTKTYTKMLRTDRNFVNLKIGNFLMSIGVNYNHEDASVPLKNASQVSGAKRSTYIQVEKGRNWRL